MSLGVNLLMYLTEITSKSLGRNFLSKVYEIIIKIKRLSIRTALMLGRGIAIGKNKNFHNMMGRSSLTKHHFLMEIKLILIQ